METSQPAACLATSGARSVQPEGLRACSLSTSFSSFAAAAGTSSPWRQTAGSVPKMSAFLLRCLLLSFFSRASPKKGQGRKKNGCKIARFDKKTAMVIDS